MPRQHSLGELAKGLAIRRYDIVYIRSVRQPTPCIPEKSPISTTIPSSERFSDQNDRTYCKKNANVSLDTSPCATCASGPLGAGEPLTKCGVAHSLPPVNSWSASPIWNATVVSHNSISFTAPVNWNGLQGGCQCDEQRTYPDNLVGSLPAPVGPLSADICKAPQMGLGRSFRSERTERGDWTSTALSLLPSVIFVIRLTVLTCTQNTSQTRVDAALTKTGK